MILYHMTNLNVLSGPLGAGSGTYRVVAGTYISDRKLLHTEHNKIL